MRFSANFQDFFKIQKIRNLKLIVSQLFGVSQSSQRSYLLVKLHFWCFLDTQNSCYLKVQKTAKMRFYEQVWSVWWLRYSKKLTYNKFEVSDFLNFEKILKIRWKTQKRVIFTKMLFSLRRVKTALVKLLKIFLIFKIPKVYFSGFEVFARFRSILHHHKPFFHRVWALQMF